MTENGITIDSTQSYVTILVLCFFLAALVILLFFMYKYLNKEANGKYTVQRIVFREGGLRDRARLATVALGNRLGIQLWPQSDTDEENEEDEEEGQVNSNGDVSGDEDDSVKVNMQKSDSAAGLHNAKRSSEHNSVDSSDEEEQALVKHEPEPEAEEGKAEEPAADEAQEDNRETSGPIVINLNQFSGSVLWSMKQSGGPKCEPAPSGFVWKLVPLTALFGPLNLLHSESKLATKLHRGPRTRPQQPQLALFVQWAAHRKQW